jgi:hypothetical protein
MEETGRLRLDDGNALKPPGDSPGGACISILRGDSILNIEAAQRRRKKERRPAVLTFENHDDHGSKRGMEKSV